MSRSKEKRFLLVEKQSGISPLTGRSLKGQRLETHHIIEVYEGGTNRWENGQVLPIAEHLAKHFERSRDPSRSKEERQREFNTVAARVHELTPGEERDLMEIAFQMTGIRIRITKRGIQFE